MWPLWLFYQTVYTDYNEFITTTKQLNLLHVYELAYLSTFISYLTYVSSWLPLVHGFDGDLEIIWNL